MWFPIESDGEFLVVGKSKCTCALLNPSPQAEHRDSGKLSALKKVPIADETEMEDFMVEIDILATCRHENIVGLHEAYFYDETLWVRYFTAAVVESGLDAG